MYYNSLVLK